MFRNLFVNQREWAIRIYLLGFTPSDKYKFIAYSLSMTSTNRSLFWSFSCRPLGLNTLSINAFGCTSHLENVMVVAKGILRQWRVMVHSQVWGVFASTSKVATGPSLFSRCFLGKQCSVWIHLYKYSENKAAQCQTYLLFRGFVGLVTVTFRGGANRNV